MSKFSQSFSQRLYTNRFGLLAFIGSTLVTAAVLAATQNITTTTLHSNPISDPVKISSKLSQTKLVKGENNTIYLDVSIKPPSINTADLAQRASDIIVILDRSGSMSGANKMGFAKAAIHDLLARLNDTDRFALISFSNNATVHAPLTTVDYQQRQHLNSIVQNIQIGGGTNISAGLNKAVSLLRTNPQNHSSKVLILSDGHANQGVTDLTGLSQIIAKLTQQESVLSSIGMGLDFNETLMSSFADYGMGNYNYLEDLSGLSSIFANNLAATRNIYAANSSLTLQLNQGIELVDAGGYPITKTGAHTFNIKTGQLLGNHQKKFVITFKVTANEIGTIALGHMQLAYQANGVIHQQALLAEQLQLAVVEPERRQEATASIDKEVYKQSWLKNNMGRMQKSLSYWVRNGNKDKADQVIKEYRDEVSKAEHKAAMPVASAEMDAQLMALESSVADAFSGTRSDQDEKRKRAAKSIQLDSLKAQRAIK